MSLSRAGCLLLTVLVTGACGGTDIPKVTAPTNDTPATVNRRTLQRVDEVATSVQPLDAWMGTTLNDVLRVRVLDANGHGVSGAAVRFARARDGARMDVTNSTRDDTTIVVTSDASGVATAGAWMLPLRDTVAVVYRASAHLAGSESSTIHFAARAWRDLSQFGGSSALVLDRLPVARSLVWAILPLGTFGTDDALPSADALLLLRTAGPHVIHAVADGMITEIDTAAGAVTMRLRDHVRIRIAGFSPRTTLWVGRVMNAGDPMGTVDASRARDGVAVRVLDATTHRTRWVNPERYGARRNATFFVRYLADSLRSQMFGLVRRAAPDLDGRIDYDRGGRLVGSWFAATAVASTNLALSAATRASTSPYAALRAADVDPSASLAPVALTFAYDAERPGQVRIAVGSALAVVLGLRGVRAVAWEDPDPADVDATRGVVRYHLYDTDDEVRMGRADRVLLVQLVASDTLRAEVVAVTGSETAVFSSRVVTLIR